MKIDKKEKYWWNKKKFAHINQIFEEEFKDTQKGLGFYKKYWARKKQLLKELYNIDWKTPEELNPGIIFD